MIEYVEQNWTKSAIHLASYLMWRVNWIHPFENGNGRTSRAISYVVLCIRLGFLLPGDNTIPDQITDDKKDYYAALDEADARWTDGKLDVSKMEELLEALLGRQLLSVYEQATGSDC